MFQKIYSVLTSSLSFRFILSFCIALVLCAFLLATVFTASVVHMTEDSVTINQRESINRATDQLAQLFSSGYITLETDLGSPSLKEASPFDAGILTVTNSKEVILAKNSAAGNALKTAAGTVSSSSPRYIFDKTDHLIIISAFKDSRTYALGAISGSNSDLTDILQSTYHTYLADNTGYIIATNTPATPASFISSLQFPSQSPQQILLGNLRREILSHEPIGNTGMEVIFLSDPFLYTFIQTIPGIIIEVFVICFILAVITMLEYIAFIYTPLQKIHSFAVSKKGILPYSSDIIGLLGRDIHTAQNMEVTASEEYRTQEDFLLLSGHLLRTPLTALAGYAGLLDELSTDERTKKIISDMHGAISRLTQIEENILALNDDTMKVIQAKEESVILSAACKEAFERMKAPAQEKELTYLLDTSSLEGVTVRINYTNLLHAIKNILDNAVKFTHTKGTVKLYGKKKDGKIIISVSDTGIGLTKEEIEVIFHKFSRLGTVLEYNSDGLGIGLYVTKTIIEKAGGKVWVDSIKGSGSIFNLMLPIEKKL